MLHVRFVSYVGALQVASTVRQQDSVVPCDVLFDPLSKQYMLACFRNGSMCLYGINDVHNLTQVSCIVSQICSFQPDNMHCRRVAATPVAHSAGNQRNNPGSVCRVHRAGDMINPCHKRNVVMHASYQQLSARSALQFI